MTRPVSFHRLASETLGEAINDSELESTGLGATFLSVVERASSQFEELPESAPVARGRIRKKPIGRFPDGLLFVVRVEVNRILALMHQRRRPGRFRLVRQGRIRGAGRRGRVGWFRRRTVVASAREGRSSFLVRCHHASGER